MKNKKTPQTAWGRGAAFALLLACAPLSAFCEDPAKPAATDSTRPEMVRVAGGTFTMGSRVTEAGRISSETRHTVTVSSFYIGKYEVTQGQYRAVMGTNPSRFTGSDRLPVEQVTWYDAVEFCNKLSVAEGLTPAYTITGETSASGHPTGDASVTMDRTKSGYRLPTEAEWEYAARGGANWNNPYYVYAGSNTAGDVAWYRDNSSSRTHEVGGKAANSLGLYDMTGNVFEWCWDWYAADNTSGSQTDPVGASSGSIRVTRGGGWGIRAVLVRSACRYGSTPSTRNGALGFRLVRP